MSTLSEQVREKSKSKAERMGRADPVGRVDASGYSPDGNMDAGVQTGPRPISRRQFRQGGKVSGEAAPARADRKARASGGLVNALINRDVKAANQERAGIKHIGGMKSGGRAHKLAGGPLTSPSGGSMNSLPPTVVGRNTGGATHGSGCGCAKCSGGRVGRKSGGPAINDGTRPVAGRLARKGGGRTKKGTNVNIIITQPGGMGGPRPAMPMPPPDGPVGLHQGAPPPMPPAGGPPPAAMPPPGAMPLARKSGGRTLEKDGGKLAKPGAYPIESGGGGGLGRLEKAKAYGA